MAKQLPVAALEDILFSLMKKMYMREKVKGKEVINEMKKNLPDWDSSMLPITKAGYEKLMLNNECNRLGGKYMWDQTIDRALKIAGLTNNLKDADDKDSKMAANNTMVLEKTLQDIYANFERSGVSIAKLEEALTIDGLDPQEYLDKIAVMVPNMKPDLVSESDIANIMLIKSKNTTIKEAKRNLVSAGYAVDDLDPNIISESMESW
jgi:hypothetical protein